MNVNESNAIEIIPALRILTDEEDNFISDESLYTNTRTHIGFCGIPDRLMLRKHFPLHYQFMQCKFINKKHSIVTRCVFKPYNPHFTKSAPLQKILKETLGAEVAQMLWNSVSAVIPKSKTNADGKKEHTYAIIEFKVSVEDQVHNFNPVTDINKALAVVDRCLKVRKRDPNRTDAIFEYWEYMNHTHAEYPFKYTLIGLSVANTGNADIHHSSNLINCTRTLLANFPALDETSSAWQVQYKHSGLKKGFQPCVIQIASKHAIHDRYKESMDRKGKFNLPYFRDTDLLLSRQRNTSMRYEGHKYERKPNKEQETNAEYIKEYYEHLVDSQLGLIPAIKELMRTVQFGGKVVSLGRAHDHIEQALDYLQERHLERKFEYSAAQVISYAKANYGWIEQTSPESGTQFSVPVWEVQMQKENYGTNAFQHIQNLALGFTQPSGPNAIGGLLQ